MLPWLYRPWETPAEGKPEGGRLSLSLFDHHRSSSCSDVKIITLWPETIQYFVKVSCYDVIIITIFSEFLILQKTVKSLNGNCQALDTVSMSKVWLFCLPLPADLQRKSSLACSALFPTVSLKSFKWRKCKEETNHWSKTENILWRESCHSEVRLPFGFAFSSAAICLTSPSGPRCLELLILHWKCYWISLVTTAATLAAEACRSQFSGPVGVAVPQM